MAKNQAKSDSQIPSILSYEGKIVCSDALMYSCKFDSKDDPNKNPNKIMVCPKTVRGTKSNRIDPSNESQVKALPEPNPHTVDAASLGEDDDTLLVSFTVKFLGNISEPASCNDFEYQRNKLVPRIQEAIDNKSTIRELSRRYAINIANARYLFRNRHGAEEIEVVVTCRDGVTGKEEKLEFNALEIPCRDFDYKGDQVSDIDKLAAHIQQVLESKDKYSILDVKAYAKIGRRQVVYPSQELILDGKVVSKDGDEKKKVLYRPIKGDDQAGMHSQKIGNAIRTIDTFYPEYETYSFGPIAIEPYGAVTTIAQAFRSPGTEKDFYTLLEKYIDEKDLEPNDLNFLIAVLIRGGVFGS